MAGTKRAAGAADRSKAARLRSKLKAGRRLAAAESRWLSAYEDERREGPKNFRAGATSSPAAPENFSGVSALAMGGGPQPPKVTLDDLGGVVDPMTLASVPVVPDAPAAEGDDRPLPSPAGAAVVGEQAPAPGGAGLAIALTALVMAGLEAAADIAAARAKQGKPVSMVYGLAARHKLAAVEQVHAAACRLADKYKLGGALPFQDELLVGGALGGSVYVLTARDELIAAGDVAPPAVAAPPGGVVSAGLDGGEAPASAGLDYAGLAVGPPKVGKTYLAATLSKRWLARGEWVFVHDPNHNPDFRKAGMVSYDDVRAYVAAARVAAAKKRPFPRGAIIGGEASDVVDLVDGIGLRCNRATRVTMPMRLVLDEGSSLGSSGSSWMGPKEQRLWAQRRHRGVGPLLLTQDVTMLHPRFMKLSTKIYVYPGLSPADLKTLEKRVAMRQANPFASVDCAFDPGNRFFLVCSPQGGFSTEVE